MINEKLLEIIKELKKQGKTEDQIKEILAGYNVNISEVEENLKHYSENRFSINQSVFPEDYTTNTEKSESPPSLDVDAKPPKKFNFKPILVIFGILIVGLVVFFLFSNLSKNTLVDDNLDENISAPDENISLNENYTLLERFSSYSYPLEQSTVFNLSFSEDNHEAIIEGNVYMKEDNIFNIDINTTLNSDGNSEEIYTLYGSLAMMSFFYPSFIVPAYNPELMPDPTAFDMFVSGDDYLDIPDTQKLRYFILKSLYPSDILEGDYDPEVSKLTSAILNPNYNYDIFNVSYNVNHNSELFKVFEFTLNNSLQEVETKMYNLETQEATVEVISYSELFDYSETEDYNSNTSENNLQNNNISGSSINLGIDFSKDNYFVGDTLEGSKYTFSYQGDPFEGKVIYSKEDSYNTTYSSSKGTISSGSFDDSLAMLRHTMYTLDADLNPNPFTCDGFYRYSIYVYSCQDIDAAMGTDDCGTGGYPPTIDVEDIVLNVDFLDAYSDSIYVACSDGSVDCCID